MSNDKLVKMLGVLKANLADGSVSAFRAPSVMTTVLPFESADGTPQIRKEERNGGERWGYDVWIRQPDGSRKRYRDFTFATKAEATQALAALRTTGWKTRYGVNPPEKTSHTTNQRSD